MFSQGAKYSFDNLLSGGFDGKNPVIGETSYFSNKSVVIVIVCLNLKGKINKNKKKKKKD